MMRLVTLQALAVAMGAAHLQSQGRSEHQQQLSHHCLPHSLACCAQAARVVCKHTEALTANSSNCPQQQCTISSSSASSNQQG
jgi:hypothetical protein